ncbi:stage V sporulation protein D (sporulation-specific penicillin-binding protein) [Halanaerobium saccharolyticum]|uniref:Stage V sporulation protein D (Sporulation-specific penicillin-binding protein) n=1 Tax=Halanaerobium saccharolyticum TaxID=43595 RepID=A0A4R7YYH3_9FIRM|nr:PASTA domain-containing penicillin-binding protein [Halanaerobium saccharolyticum]RAK07412.1 stage V sporulation protein D (sporulation-specific penicillin-binding protein) [Halanaerobium saccharolyticum]TDW02377.1 stage V sporulation protein D (sporulation-specific penicillin-binding protein) [Halanaerobium saccharolyticum]TDX59097.1 stage V sporulation protein D (sporulation-specific penicillin-binding protein) [Halanaerobium saccharolyticum]
MQQLEKSVKNRVIFYFAIIFILFIILALRLVWIQVINSAEYEHKALNQRVKEFVVNSERGIIYDNTGRKLAVSLPAKTVVALPDNIINPEKTASELAEILDNDYNTIYRRITSSAAAIFLQRKVSEKTYQKIENKNLKGITFTEESKRYYPEGELASHIIGFTGVDNNGLNGLELSYNNYLSGKAGKMIVEKDAEGRTIPNGIREAVPGRDGYNVHLTIDEVIQYMAEKELKNAAETFDFSGGSVIVMDSSNGDLLAMANTPAYNPNNFADYPEKNWRNRAINDVFEPGSTFKIITAASALEEGVITENDILTDPGHIYVENEEISCWSNVGHGSQSFAEVVKNSCNPGFVEVGLKMDKETFYSYIKAFGFGEQTGIRLPAEAAGIIPEYKRIGPLELATFSFGHGLSVTPIQLASAVSAVANEGKLMRPRLVKKVDTGSDSKNIINEPQVVRQVISKSTADKTKELLKQVVESGTGTQAAIEGYEIGGKTGTAKHYNEDIYDSSFIGIVPAEGRDLVILTILYDIKGETYYGSQTAAPVFRNLTANILNYLNIKPDRNNDFNYKQEQRKIMVPDLIGTEFLAAETSLREKGFNVKLIGDEGVVKNQLPASGVETNYNSTVWLFSEKKSRENMMISVPDFRGMTGIEAEELAGKKGLDLILDGSGEVVGQSVYPGSRVKSSKKINLKLQ